jgi:hypothetical protein
MGFINVEANLISMEIREAIEGKSTATPLAAP